MLYKNLHIGPRQGKEPGSIVSYCAGPVPCTCPGPVPVQHFYPFFVIGDRLERPSPVDVFNGDKVLLRERKRHTSAA